MTLPRSFEMLRPVAEEKPVPRQRKYTIELGLLQLILDEINQNWVKLYGSNLNIYIGFNFQDKFIGQLKEAVQLLEDIESMLTSERNPYQLYYKLLEPDVKKKMLDSKITFLKSSLSKMEDELERRELFQQKALQDIIKQTHKQSYSFAFFHKNVLHAEQQYQRIIAGIKDPIVQSYKLLEDYLPKKYFGIPLTAHINRHYCKLVRGLVVFLKDLEQVVVIEKARKKEIAHDYLSKFADKLNELGEEQKHRVLKHSSFFRRLDYLLKNVLMVEPRVEETYLYLTSSPLN